MNEKFAHLHLHTDASLRDGLGTVPRMITRAKDMGFKMVAMTDHGTLANAVTFTMEAIDAGLKPLLGLEGYVVVDGVIGHITLLADGMRGWHSLLELNNLAHLSDYKQPAFHIDDLITHADGLVCLSGCIASPLQQLPLGDARRLAIKLKAAFGHKFFAEMMFVGDNLAWERPLRLADDLGLKTVITNDVHFPEASDATVHPVLTRMKAGFDYNSTNLYLKSYNQLYSHAMGYGLKEELVVASLERTAKIGALLDPIVLSSEPHLPVVKGGETLPNLIRKSSRWFILKSKEYYDRYLTELKIIQDMGYEDYFIILDDIIKNAKARGVRVGPGRGSGAGSLILYVLEITDVDPIKYGLEFERFLNPERRGMPDVDVDIDSENRERVLEYAAETYSAVPIATYSRYSHKSLTRDLGKMFKIDKKLIDKAAEGGPDSDAFYEICRDKPKFIKAYEAFLGQIRHKGKHAGGVIITETPVPVERISDGVAAAWTEGRRNELSYAGIVKFDLLGLSILSALRRLEEQFDCYAEEPTDGHPAFEIFRSGNLSGVFQFSGSEGIRQLTMDLAPDKFEDLIAINALYRPGAIDAGATERYKDWKKVPRDVPEWIADILAPTYGAIVYQEQFMAIFARAVGGTMGEADLARRIITKSKPDDPRWLDKFTRLRAQFVGKCQSDWGMNVIEATNLWEELATHTRYSFNKSHSTAYARIAWECAWWKFVRPAEFYAAMLNVDSFQEQTYIVDAVKADIEIVAPHVNSSTREWVAEDGKIFMPLSSIKFMGVAGETAIVKEREAGGKFTSLENFMARVPKRFVRARAREGLLRLFGFSGLYRYPMASAPHKWEEVLEILGLKDLVELKTKGDTQLRYLGFIIPTKKLLAEWEDYAAKGWTCGIIESRDARESKWGPYMVYRLSPSGVFWSRDVMDLEKGTIVAVQIAAKGKAKAIKILRS